ncbi:MAG: hypothetical protein VX127_11640, partial [Myxococcota bacterium]|nr:hypothetical protein [Myxococcota bacterium]
MTRSVPLAITAAIVGCGEQKVSARNEFPIALITSHSDGDLVPDGDVSLVGTVSDVDDPPETLVAHWLVNGVEACPARPPDDGGISQCTVSAVDGSMDVQLLVKDPLNAVGTDRLTLAIAPTSPPHARLVSPHDAMRLYTDAKVTFEGVVGDEEDEAVTLDVRLESDLQPDLDVPLTVDSDGTVSGFGYLDEGEHALVLRVVDSDGKTSSDGVVVEVGPPNTAPECSIHAPLDGDVVSPMAPITLRGEARDADQPSDTLAIEWRSDTDGMLATDAATTDGDALAVVTGLSPGPHILTLAVTDERDAGCTASVVIQVGTAPTVRVDAPLDGTVLPLGDSVTLQASVFDAEDALATLSVSWNSDVDGPVGTAGADPSGVAVVEAELGLGAHVLSATTTDAHGMTASAAVAVMVDDVPTVTDVAIVPVPAFAGDVLRCEWAFSDATGSDASTAEWSMAGATLGTGPTMAGPWVRGDSVTCTVTPFDGVFEGTAVSATISVSNTAPVASAAVISPTLPRVGDALTCSLAGFTDADGDADASHYAWRVGDAEVGTGATWSGAAVRGDEVTCTATPHDGVDSGVPQTASVTIGNGLPSIDSAILMPAAPTTETDISVTAVTTDPDGDPVTISWDWVVNGIPTGVTGDALDSSHFARSDSVEAVGVPHDGTDAGPPFAVGPTIVQNTPPEAPTVAIEPGEPTEGTDPLLCVVSPAGVPDVDGDAVGYTVVWTRDGAVFTGTDTTTIAGDTVPGASTSAGELWVCEAVPTDGIDDGPSGEDSVVVESAQTRVFVTSEAYSSDFGGPFGADDACTGAAEAAGLSGSWTAFVSGGGATAIGRIADGPYVRLDGELIAEDRAELAGGSIRVPINVTELGGGYTGFVCTGSSPSGSATGGSTASGGNCAGWTRGCGVCFGNHWYVTVGHTGYTNDDWVDRGWNRCGGCR